MRKGSDVIGLPVVTIDTGERKEKVHDILFDQSTNQLLGLLVDEGGWFSEARVLPLRRINAIGADAILTDSAGSIVPASSDPNMNAVLKRNNVLKGTTIMTTDGKDLGKMVDLYFDETTGHVTGYEVSGGVFSDMVGGRSFVPAPQTLDIGEHFAFVPPGTAELMEEQVGGLKAQLQSAGESLTNVKDAAVEKAGELKDKAGDALQTAGAAASERVDGLKESAAERLAATTLDEARGRRVRSLVRGRDGVIVAAEGQIADDAVLERARAHNAERELLEAVNLPPGSAARGTAAGAAQSAGETAKHGAEVVVEGATNLWQTVKEKVSHLKEEGTRADEERRINIALGRPVTRIILDPQDHVILNTGEIVTHEAIRRAREGGVLEILLDSIDTSDPVLPATAFVAAQPGEASIPSLATAEGDVPAESSTTPNPA